MKKTNLHPLLLAALLATFVLTGTPTIHAGEAANSTKASNDRALKEAIVLLDNSQERRSDLAHAKVLLDRILANDPRAIGAHREYIRYHIKNGYRGYEVAPEALAAAEASLNAALSIDPKDVGSLVLAGHLYHEQRRYADARVALTKAEAIGTTNPWLDLNWADLLESEGKRDEAAIRYQRVLDARPDNSGAMSAAFSGMVNFYAANQRPDDVDRTYRAQIAYKPSDAWPHGNYGLFLLCTRDNAAAAVVEYKKALSLMNYGMAQTGLAAATWRLWAGQQLGGQLQLAKATQAEARKLSGEDPLALVEGRCGDFGTAKAVRKALGKG